MLYRPQYFDKIVAWGGGDAINNVIKYLGPGFQLVSFDPKTSISMVGRGGLRLRRVIAEIAPRLAATDVMMLQPGGLRRQPLHLRRGRPANGVERFCERCRTPRRRPRHGVGSRRVRSSTETCARRSRCCSCMDDEYGVWGKTDGRGLVIRSDEPVDFHPINKTANVVRVDSLDDAMKIRQRRDPDRRRLPVRPDARDCATGWPAAARSASSASARRGQARIGDPHDAMYPLHRFVHWMSDEDA